MQRAAWIGSLVVTLAAAACGASGAGHVAPPSTGNQSTDSPATHVALADVPCGEWKDAAALCECQRGESLAIDEWSLAAEESKLDAAADAPLPPAECSAPPTTGLGFVLEGHEEFRTLWLVEARGDQVRAVAGPLVGQVQGKRWVSEVVGGEIKAFGPAGLGVVAARYEREEYREEVFGEPDEQHVEYVLLCQALPAGTACLRPILTATRRDAMHEDDLGNEVVTRRASVQRVVIDETGFVSATVDGDPLEADERLPVDQRVVVP